jgi:hypothetical protein
VESVAGLKGDVLGVGMGEVKRARSVVNVDRSMACGSGSSWE